MGEESRREGGKIFDSGSRAPIAIAILVKDASENHKIYYHDIGDYLTRENKLKLISNYKSINSMQWKDILPDINNDWLNQRDELYQKFKTINGDVFLDNIIGVQTSRDAWVYNFSENKVSDNIDYFVENYNSELKRLKSISDTDLRWEKVDKNNEKIKWSSGLKNLFLRGRPLEVDKSNITISMYRPFTKKHLFYDKPIIHRPGRFKERYIEGH